MIEIINKYLTPAVFLFSLFACTDTISQNDIALFERPQDIALACYHKVDGEVETLPLACCEEDTQVEFEDEEIKNYCASPLADASLLAFVTQTTMGEVAVVDVSSQQIIDQDIQIPYLSFIPVGSQPADITSSWDGKNIYTANFETWDISIIETRLSFGPVLTVAKTINIEGPGARIALSGATEQDTSIRDKFAFVTQPTMGRLAVVALDPSLCLDENTDNNGCLLGYMRLDSTTGATRSFVDSRPSGIHPWSIVASKSDFTIYIGGLSGVLGATGGELAEKEGNYILKIDSRKLAAKALEEYTANGSAADITETDEIILDRFELSFDEDEHGHDGFTTRSLALEPELERWLYAVENELGGVIVLSTLTGEILPVNETNNNILASNPYSIEFPGRARTVAMMRFSEDDDPAPLTFNGTFAMVSVSNGAIYVLDVEDENGKLDDPYEFTINHARRSDVNYNEEYTFPGLVDTPLIYIDENSQTAFLTDDYSISFEDVSDSLDGGTSDAGTGDASVDPGECSPGNFMEPDEYGFAFGSNIWFSTSETWLVAWEGTTGISGVAKVVDDSFDPATESVLIIDEDRSFCQQGLNTGIHLPDDYEGDTFVLEALDSIAPGAECPEEAKYTIIEVEDEQTLRISNSNPGLVPPPAECFGNSFTYAIKASGHWIIRGSVSGRLYDGEFDKETKSCKIGKREIQGFVTQRVTPNQVFCNPYFAFNLNSSGEIPEDTYILFETEGGFSPLAVSAGVDVSDIALGPGSNVYIVDQSDSELIIFDLINSFSKIGDAIR